MDNTDNYSALSLDKELLEIAASYVEQPYTPDVLFPYPGEYDYHSRLCDTDTCRSVNWVKFEDPRISVRDTLSGAVQDV